jgi:hypothetical protein
MELRLQQQLFNHYMDMVRWLTNVTVHMRSNT